MFFFLRLSVAISSCIIPVEAETGAREKIEIFSLEKKKRKWIVAICVQIDIVVVDVFLAGR